VDQNILNTRGLRSLAQCNEMILMRMDAAIADQTDEVKPRTLGLGKGLE
jgi:hypothetical protein